MFLLLNQDNHGRSNRAYSPTERNYSEYEEPVDYNMYDDDVNMYAPTAYSQEPKHLPPIIKPQIQARKDVHSSVPEPDIPIADYQVEEP